MSASCPFCSALHWASESTAHNENGDLLFESCCKKGSVTLDPFPSPPPLLRDLFQSNSRHARDFRSNIRAYNSALSYTSFAYTPDRRLNSQEYNYLFQLQGTVYHYQGPLQSRGTPSYCQLFFIDPTEATRIRNERNADAGLDVTILRAHDVLNRNPELQSLRFTPQLRLIPNDNADPRRYNLPTVTSELAALVPDIPGEYGSPSFRDILLYPRTRPGSSAEFEHSLTRIYPNHALYLPLHTRPRPFQSLHRGENLFQQFVVDAWASTEGMDLDFLRYNQPKLRADLHAVEPPRTPISTSARWSPAPFL
jgi:hypothetical protein